MPDPFRLSHVATVRVAAPAAAVFAFMTDPVALGGWSLGCMDTRPDPAAGPAVHTGRSLYDGGQGWFAIDADPANLNRIRALRRCERHHLVGGGADRLPPRVGILFARIGPATRRATCNRDRRASLSVDQECLDRGAPQVEGEKRGANGSTHQVRRR